MNTQAAVMCEQCRILMIERVPRKLSGANKEQAIVLECPQCGRVESQPLITSFWRRLAA